MENDNWYFFKHTIYLSICQKYFFFISYYYLEKFVNPSFKNELFVVKQFQKSTLKKIPLWKILKHWYYSIVMYMYV